MNRARRVLLAKKNRLKIQKYTFSHRKQTYGKVTVQSESIIRGDLADIRTGRYCIISKNAVIRSLFKKFSYFRGQSGLKDCCHIEDSAVVTKNNCAIFCSFHWQFDDVHRRVARVAAL